MLYLPYTYPSNRLWNPAFRHFSFCFVFFRSSTGEGFRYGLGIFGLLDDQPPIYRKVPIPFIIKSLDRLEARCMKGLRNHGYEIHPTVYRDKFVPLCGGSA
jgi:hypothetical protein